MHETQRIKKDRRNVFNVSTRNVFESFSSVHT